jgi:hypothetical protein
MGAASVFERDNGGIDVEWDDDTVARPGNARLLVDADIGLGHLDIRKTDPRDDWHRDWDRNRDRREWDDWDGWQDDVRGSNTACAA